jgi:hypothetical protein
VVLANESRLDGGEIIQEQREMMRFSLCARRVKKRCYLRNGFLPFLIEQAARLFSEICVFATANHLGLVEFSELTLQLSALPSQVSDAEKVKGFD